MAVNSEIGDAPIKKINYPFLMISKFNNVWLMYDCKRGKVVHVGQSSNTVGQHGEMLDINEMKPFHGSITLTNE